MKFIQFIVLISLLSAHDTDCRAGKLPIPPSKGINSLEDVVLGGISQKILINSNDVRKPLLLILHGGPAFSLMGLSRKYHQALDDHFIVVNWDQRGANLSYRNDIPQTSMTIEQIVADAHELTGLLKKRFHKRKLLILGHSWGTAVGLLLARQYPQDYAAYIGVGQVVNMEQNERVSLQFAVAMAQQHHNPKAVNELNAILPYPAAHSTLQQLYTSRRWMDYYGGEVYGQHGPEHLFRGVADGTNPLYDIQKSEAGIEFSMPLLWPPFMKTDFARTIPRLKVPVYFLLGKHDFNVPYTLAERYFGGLKAPEKHLLFFNQSTHFLQYEEPQKFIRVLAAIGRHVG